MASEPKLVTIDPNGDTLIILENPKTWLLDPTLGQQLEVKDDTDSDIDSNSDESIAYDATEHASHDSAANESSSPPAVKFLVSSRQLRIVSSYFDSIFKGGYNETVLNPADGLYHIRAEGWDAEAMEVIMNIVHVQVKRIPEYVSLELFVKILVLVDYYHMQDAIASHATLWMSQTIGSDRPTSYSAKAVYWLFLAIRMGDRTLSRNMARVIITTASRPITFQGLPFPPELEGRKAPFYGQTHANPTDR
ncbi:uncharacterized protein J4E84_007359 [Alternaria hordeiaustralica]|uniref:uncharacterized protein n=1 Tax=Alternaria hordeiaustralica TaxID=1187925 RepID=UPI0020C4808C|nr:uncharacterized protein J4E84_007359 [Alternaria hordeiaustralica]KAI4681764.1 hypothetical protein J4E84_007359 [Alternaria hordeiaustralica]